MDEIKKMNWAESINWNEELLKRGFILLEFSTRTFGNGKFTGSIVDESWDGKFFTIAEKKGKNTKEVFCPFLHAEENSRPNFKFQEIRLRNTEDLDNYINARLAELGYAVASKPTGKP